MSPGKCTKDTIHTSQLEAGSKSNKNTFISTSIVHGRMSGSEQMLLDPGDLKYLLNQSENGSSLKAIG